MKYNTNHTFAICAYKESPHLEACVNSLVGQTVQSNIIITTSTPNKHIRQIADKYKIQLHEENRKSDIKRDWNFAYNMAKTDFVTVVHQDDLYHKDYVKYLLKSVEKDKNVIIFFTDYLPIKRDKIGERDINSKLRRLCRLPLKVNLLSRVNWIKTRCLSLGNCICCPSVTYNKKMLGKNVFTSPLKFSIDWDTFYKLSKKKGKFSYIDKPLIYYRIYDGATTKEFIVNHTREAEDIYMFNKFWPHCITKLFMKFYVKAYDTYN